MAAFDKLARGTRRLILGVVAAAPGAGLLWLYIRRLGRLRENPALSPGTPGETFIALMVLAIAVAAFLLGHAVARGALGRPLAAGAYLSLAAIVVVMGLGVVGLF